MQQGQRPRIYGLLVSQIPNEVIFAPKPAVIVLMAILI